MKKIYYVEYSESLTEIWKMWKSKIRTEFLVNSSIFLFYFFKLANILHAQSKCCSFRFDCVCLCFIPMHVISNWMVFCIAAPSKCFIHRNCSPSAFEFIVKIQFDFEAYFLFLVRFTNIISNKLMKHKKCIGTNKTHRTWTYYFTNEGKNAISWRHEVRNWSFLLRNSTTNMLRVRWTLYTNEVMWSVFGIVRRSEVRSRYQ